MRIDFPKVTKPIRLAEYTEELGATEIRVWVNVPSAMIERVRELKRLKDDEVFAWLSEMWGIEAWPVDDIQALWKHCMENDPALWGWLMSKTIELLFEYRAGVKKA